MYFVYSIFDLCLVFIVLFSSFFNKKIHRTNRWFPKGVPRRTGVPWNSQTCAAKFWIFFTGTISETSVVRFIIRFVVHDTPKCAAIHDGYNDWVPVWVSAASGKPVWKPNPIRNTQSKISFKNETNIINIVRICHFVSDIIVVRVYALRLK